MEKIGLINRYVCDSKTHAFHTINLNVGTTPFITKCLECDSLAQSSMYQVKNKINLVKYCWYRPIREFMLRLDVGTQRHVLNGGLVLGKLGRVVPLVDPVTVDWDLENFSEFVEDTYGVKSPGNRGKFSGIS